MLDKKSYWKRRALKIWIILFRTFKFKMANSFYTSTELWKFIVFNAVSIPTDVTKSKDTGIVKFIWNLLFRFV